MSSNSQYHYFGSFGITCFLKPGLTVNDSDWQFSGSLALVLLYIYILGHTIHHLNEDTVSELSVTAYKIKQCLSWSYL